MNSDRWMLLLALSSLVPIGAYFGWFHDRLWLCLSMYFVVAAGYVALAWNWTQT